MELIKGHALENDPRMLHRKIIKINTQLAWHLRLVVFKKFDMVVMHMLVGCILAFTLIFMRVYNMFIFLLFIFTRLSLRQMNLALGHRRGFRLPHARLGEPVSVLVKAHLCLFFGQGVWNSVMLLHL